MADTDPILAGDALWEQLNLGPNTRSFLKRVYAGGLDKYAHRLHSLGFEGGERALDAGCGLGQWSFALTGMCREVVGVDISSERIEACKLIAHKLCDRSIQFLNCNLDQLPFASESFDRAICYSVLNLVPYERVIEELSRVMRPGGIAYFSASGIGRFFRDVVQGRNSAADFSPRLYSARTLMNTVLGVRNGLSPLAGGVVVNRAHLERLLKQAGFDVIAAGPEGTLFGNNEPFLAAKFMGLSCAFDVLAKRRKDR